MNEGLTNGEDKAMPRGIRYDREYETMPWHRCDSVVFDIGGVLIYYAPADFLQRIFPGDPDTQAHMLRRVYQGPYWPEFDRGTMTYEEAAERLSREYGRSPKEYMRALTEWIELKQPIEEGWRAARRCRRAGMRLYLLSNYPERGYRRLREKFADRFSLFDGGVISFEAHLLKPEPAIYRRLIDSCGLDPARTLFIDDMEKNAEAAMDAGINGFHMSHAGAMDGFFV